MRLRDIDRPCEHGITSEYGCPMDNCPSGRSVEVDRIAAAKALDDHLDWSDTEDAGFAFVAASLDVIVAAVLDAAIGDDE